MPLLNAAGFELVTVAVPKVTEAPVTETVTVVRTFPL